jgi:hypothetical protein
MKKFILSALICTCSLYADAQRHSILVYGNLGLSSSKTADVKTNRFSFAPAAGYQWDDHWTGGLNLKMEHWKTEVPEVKSNTFGIGPFVRYAHPLSDIFAIYGQLNANFLSGKTAGVKMNGAEVMLFPAIGVNLKNGFALNFNFGSLGFTSGKVKGGEKSNSFGLNFGSGSGFGVSKNFGL